MPPLIFYIFSPNEATNMFYISCKFYCGTASDFRDEMTHDGTYKITGHIKYIFWLHHVKKLSSII